MNIKIENKELIIPIIPLRNIVIYPHMIVPLFVGREKSIKSLEYSMNNDKKIILLTQKTLLEDYPECKDLYSIGTFSIILQMLKLPDGTVKILVEGLKRVSIINLNDNGKYFESKVKYLESYILEEKENKAILRVAINQFENYIKLNKKISPEIFNSLSDIEDPSKISDTIASCVPMKLNDKQYILEEINISKRLEYIIKIIESEIDLLQIEKKIRSRIKKQMEKGQKEYYLNEQIKAIQKELGEISNIPDEYESIQKKIDSSNIPKDIKNKIDNELNKLKMMSSMSAEATVIRNYIDWIVSVPWKKKSKIKKNLNFAQKILDDEHYGLYEVKERILEYLAVQNRINKVNGPILCLVGPPGVGKTSLGKSIAKATGRKYEKISLGGIRDEAEIRGHRKTYIGSMPGRIIQKLSKVGVKNPLFLLDEIDKMYFDMRGDPASALLEVLDIEQNKKFNDHYLEVDYDLSDIMFIATANSTNIPNTLLDRMEIIRISSYSEEEKLNISNKYLIDKQIKMNALKNNEINISSSAILSIIRYYTREAGLRNLEREISKICRKSVKILLTNSNKKFININKNNIDKFLGVKKFDYGKSESKNQIGQSIGLAWTEYGGDLLTIETACIPGKGKLIYTGSLGEVMQESIQAALTVVRSRYKKLNIEKNFYENKDIHVHVPEGATPKDGPSAGIAICTALVSCLTNNPIKSDTAMTGEITLQGQILAIGGLKEKILAAKRGGIKNVLIPKSNIKDLINIDKNIISSINIYPVQFIEEVIKYSLIKEIEF